MKQERFVHLRKVVEGGKELMLKVRLKEAEKLVQDDTYEYVNRKVYRAWLAKQPEKKVKRFTTRPLKTEINDQSYRLNTCDRDEEGHHIIEKLTKKERKELAKMAFVRVMTETPLDKIVQRNKNRKHGRRHLYQQHQTVVCKEHKGEYLRRIGTLYGDKKPKGIILFNDLRYRSIITHPETNAAVERRNTTIPSEGMKTITFNEEFCKQLGVNPFEVQIRVRIIHDRVNRTRKPKTSTKKSNWINPIKPKRNEK